MTLGDLKLEEQGVLELLMRTAERNLPTERKSRPSRRKPRITTERPIKARPRCKCGTCLRCVEDARWERVFQEKFADPDYYGLKPRSISSLGWTVNPEMEDRCVVLRPKKAA